ncbi:MAG: phosphoribosylformylglycinamidine synthase I [archaeon]|nr:phosphoribosylformylglycinamidine synthase I [archaeon]MCP8305540.1 phosphoribosylformylglycinamidine synthase I [archaeon]
MKVAVIQFPGSNCDLDTLHVLNDIMKIRADLVWHRCEDLSGYDGVVLPGGFSYGDRLRGGIIAAHSPIMREVKRMAKDGYPVLGICNGFQILVEAGLLSGALLRNSSLKFVCKWVNLSVVSLRSIFTNDLKRYSLLKMPIAHNEGRYFIEEGDLKELYDMDQIVLKYVDGDGRATDEANPNGSMDNIAGICNTEGNVLGLMPHPERASERILSPFGSDDGRSIFTSMIEYMRRR